MSYTENGKKINKIREKYSCKGDLIFRSALPVLIEAGLCTVLDDAWYQCEMDYINERHDIAEKEGKTLFTTRDFEKAVLECERELAQFNAYALLFYIQSEMWFGEGISYKRAIELIKRCIGWIVDAEGSEYAFDALTSGVGFDSEELEDLGYGYLLDDAEEDE